MELLSSTTLNFKPLTRPSVLSTSLHTSNPLQPIKRLTNFHKLIFSSPQLILPQASTRRAPSQLSVSASAVALSEKKDKLPVDLEVTEIEEPGSRVRLIVKVPPVVCEDCYRRVLAELTKQSKVPGFRPGKKVPESILVNFVGKQYVRQATVESILERTLPHAMSSVEGRALTDSVRIITKFEEMQDKFYSSVDSLRYEILVDVSPEIKWIPENGYKNMKVIVEIDSEINAEKACEAEIKRRHKDLGALRIVTDRGLQVGDVAVLDISIAKLSKDGSEMENIPTGESKGFQLDTEEADTLPPGFRDSIMGIQRGETKSFPLVFPESWKQEDLRGVHADFNVECKELFFRDLPPLDDSLAEKLLPGCNTLDQVREAILERCKELEQTAKEQAADNAILDQLSKMVEVDIPQSLFEEQGRQFYGAQLLQFQAKTKMSEEQLASLSSPQAVNKVLESQRDNITNVIKQNLAVADVFKRENLEFPTEDLVREVENSITEFKRSNQEYDEDRIKNQVQEILEGAKVLEWLRERADIQYVTK